MSTARIRAIIAALELKTVKNGATPDEAASAQAKITSLLEECGYVKAGGEKQRGEYSWVFTVNGEHKCWIYSYEKSWGVGGKFYLHGPLEVFQKLFQQPIFRA